MINARTVSAADKAPDERTVERADNIVCAFARVRMQEQADAAANLSEAVYSLQAAVGANAPRLPVELRDRLICEIRAAAPIIRDVFTVEPADLIERCIRALFLNVECWAMSPGERNKSRHLMTDATAYARWLRNAAHNQALLNALDKCGTRGAALTTSGHDRKDVNQHQANTAACALPARCGRSGAPMPAATSPEILPSSVPSAPVLCSCLGACDDISIGDGGDIDLLADPSSKEGYVNGDGGDVDALSAAVAAIAAGTFNGGSI